MKKILVVTFFLIGCQQKTVRENNWMIESRKMQQISIQHMQHNIIPDVETEQINP